MPVPPIAELTAPSGWRAVDCISDLHLDAAHPATLQGLATYLGRTPADAVLILGDLFEFWPGSDAVQMDFEARCTEVLREAALQRHVAVMIGNRDFLLAADMLRGLGAHALDDPTLLRAWQQPPLLLTHGDGLCLSDVAFQKFRAFTRNPQAQVMFLAKPLAERVRMGVEGRHASEAGRSQESPPGGWPDIDFDAAVACLQSAGATTMVHGHTHRPGLSTLAPGFERQVLSDWDLDDAQPRAEVLRLRRDGLVRLSPDAASRT